VNGHNEKEPTPIHHGFSGSAPIGFRLVRLRRPTLYPAELRAHGGWKR
jgi:hypothetical protein